MSKPELAVEARVLRMEGWSLKKIASKLSVSPGSAHRWCSGISLTREQKDTLDSGVYTSQRVALRRANEAKSSLARAREASAQAEGKRILGSVSERDLLLLGLGLYWGEGSKSKGEVSLCNMDPEILKVFLRWLSLFEVSTSDVAATLQIAPGFDLQLETFWWAQRLGLHLNQFRKPLVKVSRTSKLKTKRTHYHGVLTLRVCSTTLSQKIRGMLLQASVLVV